MPRNLVLASTSPYRRDLLARLGVAFVTASPGVDERVLDGEAPAATATRLAEAKARAVARDHPDALVLGSDQVADLDGVAISKPGNRASAVAQLQAQSGRRIVFHTAIALLDARSGTLRTAMADVVTTFRTLDTPTIERYLDRDSPYDCAGSVRAEGLGIAMVERIDSDDPSALIGLPLIAVARLLREAGLDVVHAGR